MADQNVDAAKVVQYRASAHVTLEEGQQTVTITLPEPVEAGFVVKLNIEIGGQAESTDPDVKAATAKALGIKVD